MKDLTIVAEPRTNRGKNSARRLRAAGRIPGVIYGRGIEPVAVSVDPKEVAQILASEAGQNTIFKLAIEKEVRDVLIRDYQLDPVKGHLLHTDFQYIAMDALRSFEVPVEIVGRPKGVEEDAGILDFVTREIEVECLPADVPDHLLVEVSDLEIGDAVRVADLKVDTSKIKVLSDPDRVVATVVPARVEEEVEAAAEEEALEPEVIGRDEEEGEKASEPETEE